MSSAANPPPRIKTRQTYRISDEAMRELNGRLLEAEDWPEFDAQEPQARLLAKFGAHIRKALTTSRSRGFGKWRQPSSEMVEAATRLLIQLAIDFANEPLDWVGHAARTTKQLKTLRERLWWATKRARKLDKATLEVIGSYLHRQTEKVLLGKVKTVWGSQETSAERFVGEIEQLWRQMKRISEHYAKDEERLRKHNPAAKRLYRRSATLWFITTGMWPQVSEDKRNTGEGIERAPGPRAELYALLKGLVGEVSAASAAELTAKRFYQETRAVRDEAAKRSRRARAVRRKRAALGLPNELDRRLKLRRAPRGGG